MPMSPRQLHRHTSTHLQLHLLPLLLRVILQRQGPGLSRGHGGGGHGGAGGGAAPGVAEERQGGGDWGSALARADGTREHGVWGCVVAAGSRLAEILLAVDLLGEAALHDEDTLHRVLPL